MATEADRHWSDDDAAVLAALSDRVLASASVFARMCSVADLLNAARSRYECPDHPDLSETAVDRVLRHIHLELFNRWLQLSIREQAADLMMLKRENGDQRINLHEWGSRCIPPAASPEDRELFLQDLTMLQAVGYGELGKK